jgi:aspartate racemase
MVERLPAAIGILGGMGPWVDPLLLQKILRYQATRGMRRDQDAIPLLLAQYPELIEDRTEYLASLGSGQPLENPAVNVARVARLLVAGGACVLGIPCNTFHAAPIFSRFEEELAGVAGVEIVHMIRATLADIAARHPGAHRVGILSTNGTYLHRIYAASVAERGREAVTLPYEPRAFPGAEQEARKAAIQEGRLAPLQNDVHHAITNTQWGVKSGSEARLGYPAAKAVLKAAARRLEELGAELVILGCTEIPLALEQADVPEAPLCDPLDSLAKGLVEAYRAGRNWGIGV